MFAKWMRRGLVRGGHAGVLAAGLLWTACGWGGPPGAAESTGAAEDAGRAEVESPRAVSLGDLGDVRIVFAELQEQIRIATAKLDEAAMGRKLEMGRLTALIQATDEQLKLAAAQVQRFQTRLQDLRQDAFGGDGSGPAAALPADHPLQEPIARVQQRIKAEQGKLEQLARQRGQLKQRLDDLHREQIRQLLQAAVAPAPDEPPDGGALERVLGRTNAGSSPSNAPSP